MLRLLAVTLFAIACAAPGFARAEVSKSYNLGFEKLFSVSCRYIRIDQGGQLVEKDPEAGFVIFLWRKDKDSQEVRGTLEFVRQSEAADKPKVDLKLKLENAPKYLETYFLDGLQKKIRAEYGDVGG
jgi:hypothetical protein